MISVESLKDKIRNIANSKNLRSHLMTIFCVGTVSFLRKLIDSQGIKQNIIKATKKWLSEQVANRISGIVLGVLSGFLSWSIGSFTAKIRDRADTRPNNGYCGALW